MATQWIIGGAGCLVLVVQAGCNRENPATTPQTSSPNLSVPEEPVAEPTPETVPTTPAVIIPPRTATAVTVAVDLRRLADPMTTPEAWESAQARILEEGANAVPVLAGGLSSDDRLEREMAATMLAVMSGGLGQAETPLREALRDESDYVRANAATALCQIPDTEDAVIPVLAELLGSPDPILRQMASTNLGNFGPEAAPFVDSLAGSLENDRPDVLMPIVELLGRIGPPAESAAPKLRQIAFEQSGDVQAAATAALEQIETPQDAE